MVLALPGWSLPRAAANARQIVVAATVPPALG